MTARQHRAVMRILRVLLEIFLCRVPAEKRLKLTSAVDELERSFAETTENTETPK